MVGKVGVAETRRLRFRLIRSEKHETWRKIDEHGDILGSE
ncbi:hypothetical protein HKBW3S42_00116 [Candidatus Hakubella thermalkaliphila]|uniref:Uncharacterized protein n=1 Tax=Candidatus Hakubella thermalkaliphila TaxID=2754717 RepID=A0A6V8PLU5_9ACTN|nr:hypothetical protein HKBW3S34_01585 [Candidatus Hakubella thermalkaliphila]GFP31811.1 hypothetical protein HKBW3S42_00116 [Candidatus Hakubella thermalkaliphila]GFP34700.1 hypothetical protein HKBW3S43_00492 [Candidatus Hakubella thermalkaliphila]GFP38850.1 hypothetical protein HKBW3S47_00550 [Candidatus Hakubella thermalkaliphila]GFP43215.1 hypothetical protein HKBW3C_02345 [Candidatus Hakubella thermalkaliphila]